MYYFSTPQKHNCQALPVKPKRRVSGQSHHCNIIAPPKYLYEAAGKTDALSSHAWNREGFRNSGGALMVSLNATGFPSVSRILHLLNNIKVVDKEFYPYKESEINDGHFLLGLVIPAIWGHFVEFGVLIQKEEFFT